MKLATIIPNLNSPVIDQVIISILKQSDFPIEIWVVGQDSYGKIPNLPYVHIIETPFPLFPGAARNMGAEQVKSDMLIFLDADCIPQPGWLDTLLRAWKENPNVGAVSGAMLPESDTFIQHCGQIANFHEYLTVHNRGEREALASFSLLVPRPTWEQSGGFCSSLRHTEDIDFSLRLKKLGWKLFFEPQAQVYHCPKRTTLSQFLSYAHESGMYSIRMRLQHPEEYFMPIFLHWGLTWKIAAPIIAALRTIQIYLHTPGLWRYLYCIPWVFLHKLAWCLGAAKELTQKESQKRVEDESHCQYGNFSS